MLSHGPFTRRCECRWVRGVEPPVCFAPTGALTPVSPTLVGIQVFNLVWWTRLTYMWLLYVTPTLFLGLPCETNSCACGLFLHADTDTACFVLGIDNTVAVYGLTWGYNGMSLAASGYLWHTVATPLGDLVLCTAILCIASSIYYNVTELVLLLLYSVFFVSLLSTFQVLHVSRSVCMHLLPCTHSF